MFDYFGLVQPRGTEVRMGRPGDPGEGKVGRSVGIAPLNLPTTKRLNYGYLWKVSPTPRYRPLISYWWKNQKIVKQI